MTKYYQKIVDFLTSSEKFHIKLELDRMSKILELFDNPQDKIKTIHVAGTNGKGSCCSILNSILIEQGYKTGLFTSPHLLKYNERIKINGNNISDNEFYSILILIEKTAKKNNITLTEFEIITTAAFIWFERKGVEIAIIETGLGGRLDATNIIKSPLLTIITSISLDHTDRLGNTIEEIAAEKAGIIKQNCPCVVAKTNAGLNTIKLIATEKKAPLILSKNKIEIIQQRQKNITVINDKSYEFNLCGLYQAKNLDLCVSAIDILQENSINIEEQSIIKGLNKVKHSARFEINEKLNLVIDGAHNPDGASELRKALDAKYKNKKIKYIFATINTKDYKTTLTKLLKDEDELFLYEFKKENAVPTAEIIKHINKNIQILKNVKDIKTLIKKNINCETPIVITGSLYAIGEIYSQITENPPTG